jgi:hypothetical protein
MHDAGVTANENGRGRREKEFFSFLAVLQRGFLKRYLYICRSVAA